MDLTNPCNECIVRACCRDACAVMKEFIVEVLELIIEDPHHGILEEEFSREQADIIISTADMVRRHRENETK